MQKALTEMNVQLHHVLSDIDGVSGLRIIEAILSGERDPESLWGLRDGFRSAKHFSSWLGLCPDNRKSGGKVLSSKTRKVANRLSTTFRLSAQALWQNDSELGTWRRKMKARLGKAEGITATAHRLARIDYHLIATGEA